MENNQNIMMQQNMMQQNPNMMMQQNPNMMMQQNPNMMMQQGTYMNQNPNVMMQGNTTMGVMNPQLNQQNNVVLSQPVQKMDPKPQAPVKVESYEDVFNKQTACMVKQLVEVVEVVLGFETENKYQAYFNNGVKLQCFEDSTCMQRFLCQSRRSFEMKVYCSKKHVLSFRRPSFFLLSDLHVMDPVSKSKLGKISQKFSCCKRVFNVFVDDNKKYEIECGCCQWWTFHIKDLDGKILGYIKKQWSGLLKLAIGSDSDNFGVQFPKDASEKDKAVLFSATFLIDYLYFERDGSNSKSGALFANL